MYSISDTEVKHATSGAMTAHRAQGNNSLYVLFLLDIISVISVAYVILLVFNLLLQETEKIDVSAYYAPIAVLAVVNVMCLAAFGLYDSRRAIFSLNVLRRFTSAWFVVVASIALVAVVTKTNYTYSRAWFLLTAFSGYSIGLIWRLVLNHRARLERIKEAAETEIMVIGTGNNWRPFMQKVLSRVPHPYKEVHQREWDSSTSDFKAHLAPLLALAENKAVKQLWLIGGDFTKTALTEIIEAFDSKIVEINYFPDFSFLPTVQPELHRFADLPMITLSAKPLRATDRWLKRMFDLSFSVAMIALLLPLALAIAFVIKITSNGSVFYVQERLTIGGKVFKMLKFRTMPVNVEDQSGPVWAKQGESRATSFGAFLRRTSLDELPQFLNVLKGDMSVVGPRPERPHFVKKFKHSVPTYMQKHLVKAGITGWAQVNGLRGNTSIEDRIKHDIFYIQNWSFWLDLKIVVLTVFRGLIAESAY